MMIIPILLLALISSSFASTTILSKPTGLRIVKVQRTPVAPAIKKSIVLHDGVNWTIVPATALLFLPDSMQDRVDAKPIGKLLPWSEFFLKNASWITTDEVTFDQAAGTEALPASDAGAWKAQGKLIVAVHRDRPVSVKIDHHLRASR